MSANFDAEIGTVEHQRLVDEAIRRALVVPRIQAAAAALYEELVGRPAPIEGVSTAAECIRL